MTVIQHSECQKIIDRVMDVSLRRNQAQPAREYLGMSQIGHPCEHMLWYNLIYPGNGRVDGRLARVFEVGHVTEERLIKDLREAGYTIGGEQETFSDFEGIFRGHCDGVIYGVTKEPHILEIKSANDNSFATFKKRGVKFHTLYYAQVQCYMGYSGLERALFVAENKNNQNLYMERVYFDNEFFEGLRNKAYGIIYGHPRETPPKKTPCEYCRYCNLKPECETER
jgi:hypothetical protein